jgi:BirA family biotin operon repressor/biotin-[acetyl-CoA-carboxylase] ligase
MAFTLGPRALAGGYRLAAYERIGSTSGEALSRARDGDPGRLWVVAREQTAGHGRRGRPWQTPAGNLAASLLLSIPAGMPNTATLGFAAGLALANAIELCAPGIALCHALDDAAGPQSRLRLKWPNDVLLDGSKIAGILLEAVTGPADRGALVIGIGMNVKHAPDGVPYPATSLAACGMAVTVEELFTALSDAWVEQEAVWDGGRGFPVIRRRWLDHAAGIGGPIAVSIGADVFRGAFETIDDEGRLVVRTAEGSARAIAAGDVHFGVAATAG